MVAQEQKPGPEMDGDSSGGSQFFDKAFDAVVEEALSFYHAPGLAIGVVHKGKTFAKGYGYSNLESRIPVEPGTLFYAGSTTKSFTAAALSLLISKSSEYQNVDWTTPISSIIPEDFVLSDDWATQHMTFEDALCHRTGYPRHDRCYGNPEETLASMIRRLRHLPMTAEPRTKWQYQNIMWVVASLAIEKLAGQPLKDFLRTQIWEPLGMTNTFFTHDDALDHIKSTKSDNPSIATPYLWISSDQSNFTPLATVSEGDHFAEIPYDLPPYISGAGANITSVLDYCKYLDCMIRQAPPLTEEAHAELHKQRMPITDPSFRSFDPRDSKTIGPPQYCLGWVYEVYAPKGNTRGGIEIWQHGGGLHGFSAQMRYIPALELGIVTLGNTSPGAGYAGEVLFWEIVDNFMGVEKDVRFDWKKENLAKEAAGAKRLRGWKDNLFGELARKARKMTAPWKAHEGVFEHPAYQRMTVSVAHRQSKDNGDPEPYLHVAASPRAWNYFVELTHVHEEIFLAEPKGPYPEGEAHSSAGPGQLEDRCRAMFKLGPDGDVQSLGIELEPALVEKAKQDAKSAGEKKEGGEKHVEHDWNSIEKGMIWFERVGDVRLKLYSREWKANTRINRHPLLMVLVEFDICARIPLTRRKRAVRINVQFAVITSEWTFAPRTSFELRCLKPAPMQPQSIPCFASGFSAKPYPGPPHHLHNNYATVASMLLTIIPQLQRDPTKPRPELLAPVEDEAMDDVLVDLLP